MRVFCALLATGAALAAPSAAHAGWMEADKDPLDFVWITIAAIFVALATQVADARLAAVVLAGGAGALYMSISSFWSLSADFGGASAGSVSGVMNMANQIGSVITASLTAILADRFGWTSSFLVAAAICFVGAVLWLFIDPEHKMKVET